MSSNVIQSDPALRRILIVDDEQSVLTTLRELLTLRGFLVTAANDPQKAMEIMQQETFSVLVTDHDMPGMTGLALLVHMRELYPATTRVLVTGKIRMREMSEAAEAGIIYRYIPKPYMVEDLVLTLRNAVERYQLMTELSRLRARASVSSLKARDEEKTLPEVGADPAGTKDPESPNGESGWEESEPMISDLEVTPQQVGLAIDGLVIGHPNKQNTKQSHQLGKPTPVYLTGWEWQSHCPPVRRWLLHDRPSRARIRSETSGRYRWARYWSGPMNATMFQAAGRNAAKDSMKKRVHKSALATAEVDSDVSGRTLQTILLAVTGLSPAVLTESVWALAFPPNKAIAPTIPDRVIALTTTMGRDAITKQLFGQDSVWQKLREAVLGARHKTDSRLYFGTPEIASKFSPAEVAANLPNSLTFSLKPTTPPPPIASRMSFGPA